MSAEKGFIRRLKIVPEKSTKREILDAAINQRIHSCNRRKE